MVSGLLVLVLAFASVATAAPLFSLPANTSTASMEKNGATVTIIRHCEKCTSNCHGKQSGNNCSPTGEQRAEWLPSRFNPQCIVYCAFGCPNREKQTVAHFNAASQHGCSKFDHGCVKNVINKCGGDTLVAWEHVDIKALVNNLVGGNTPKWPGTCGGPAADRDSSQNTPGCYDGMWQFNAFDRNSLQWGTQGWTGSGAGSLASVATAAPLFSPPANDLCSTCKAGVDTIVNKGGSAACGKACSAIPGLGGLCKLICPAIGTLCGDKKVDCGEAVCGAISVCRRNPWEDEAVFNFSLPTYSPAFPSHPRGGSDTIVLTSWPPSADPPAGDVPVGMVRIGIKSVDTWWKAVTMFSNTTFIKEVAHIQDNAGGIGWGLVEHDELTKYFLSLSKAETFGIHTNVHHIVNAGDMKDGGTYLFDWQKC